MNFIAQLTHKTLAEQAEKDFITVQTLAKLHIHTVWPDSIVCFPNERYQHDIPKTKNGQFQSQGRASLF